MSNVKDSELARAIDRIRGAGSGQPTTNYYFAPLRSHSPPHWSSERSLVFLDREHDFHRVFFITHDLDDLAQLLRQPAQRQLVLDYVTGDDGAETLDAATAAAGFRKAALYRRMSHRHVSGRASTSAPDPAQESETAALFEQLCRNFDVRFDHVPEIEVLAELVRKRQVLVHRTDGEIDGYTIYQLNGRRAHWNFWYVRPGTHPAVAFKLVSDFFADMAAKKVETAYLWVEDENKGVLQLHGRLGFEIDGMIAPVYVKE